MARSGSSPRQTPSKGRNSLQSTSETRIRQRHDKRMSPSRRCKRRRDGIYRREHNDGLWTLNGSRAIRTRSDAARFSRPYVAADGPFCCLPEVSAGTYQPGRLIVAVRSGVDTRIDGRVHVLSSRFDYRYSSGDLGCHRLALARSPHRCTAIGSTRVRRRRRQSRRLLGPVVRWVTERVGRCAGGLNQVGGRFRLSGNEKETPWSGGYATQAVPHDRLGRTWPKSMQCVCRYGIRSAYS
jgi:hypothetical protein